SIVQAQVAEQLGIRLLRRNTVDDEDFKLLVAKSVQAGDRVLVIEVREHDGQAAFAFAASEGPHAGAQISRSYCLEVFQKMEQPEDFAFSTGGENTGRPLRQGIVERQNENAVHPCQPEIANRCGE